MAKEIKVQQGDTLRELAAKHLGDPNRWKELGRQIGITSPEEARNLQPGTEITIPDTDSGSLSGTMGDTQNAAGKVDSDATGADISDLSLPTGEGETTSVGSGNLEQFKSVLRKITEKANQKAKAEGLKTAQDKLGVEPSDISGRTFSGVADFVENQTTQGTEEIFSQTVDLIDKNRTRAQNQLDTLIQNDALSQMPEDQLESLAKQAGRDPQFVKSLRSAEQQESEKEEDENRFGEFTSARENDALNWTLNQPAPFQKALVWVANNKPNVTSQDVKSLLNKDRQTWKAIAKKLDSFSEDDIINVLENNKSIASFAFQQSDEGGSDVDAPAINEN